MNKDPYQIIKHLHVTEKAKMLLELKDNSNNPSIKRFENPKYVFIVDCNANKREIAEAIETIYSSKSVKVVAVNTIQVKPKKRRVRRRLGTTSGFKKAIVTLAKGDQLDDSDV